MHRNAPRRGAFIDNLLQFGVHLGAPHQDIRQRHLPDHLAQRRLRRPGDGSLVILHLQGGFLGIPHHPEKHRIHVHRHGVLGECLLGIERRNHHTVVNPDRRGVNDWNHPEQAGTLEGAEPAQPQHHRLLPLFCHLQRKQEIDREQHHRDEKNEDCAVGDAVLIHDDRPGNGGDEEEHGKRTCQPADVVVWLGDALASCQPGLRLRLGLILGFGLHGYLTSQMKFRRLRGCPSDRRWIEYGSVRPGLPQGCSPGG